jgi:hypothetical protein
MNFVLFGPRRSEKTKHGVSSPQVKDPVKAMPPTFGFQLLVGVIIILILLDKGADKNFVESVVIFTLKGR